jgi:hypothetical protein
MIAPSNQIPLAFRIGVTGTRQIRAEAETAVRAAISDVLRLVSEQIGKLAESPASQAVYIQQTGANRLGLRLVSPLAEGSDRLAAEEALKAGYALYAPLPFSQSEYENDFPGSVAEFRTLLSQAEAFELDGTRQFANESYREVGRFVVRNCDLLIAVWDGASERGPGGTAEIVRFAASLRLPVWWIDPSGKAAPRFIDDPQKLRQPRAAGLPDAERDNLRRYLERTIVPPEGVSAGKPGAFGRLAHALSDALGGAVSPLEGYLTEPGLQTKGIWRAYSVVMRAFVPTKAAASLTTSSAASDAGRWWTGYFQPADRLSEAYGNRYRSSYVLVAALAVVFAASEIGTLLPHRPEILADVVGGLAMAAIVAIVFANYYYRWHERWISYRLLAELFRKQSMLWTIGRSLPTQEILRSTLTSSESEDDESARPPADAWIGWYFAAVTRAAPQLAGRLDARKADAAKSASVLIEGQIEYHRERIKGSRAAASTMERAGQFFLFLAAIAGIIKLALWATHRTDVPAEWLKGVRGFVSAVSLSFVGLRAYSELPLLTQQSSRMIKVLKDARAELAAIEVGEPGSSWLLGHTMNALALAMMQEVVGWMQLFRLKSLEAPDVVH